MSEKARENFDEDKAVKFFEKLEGEPYSIENFWFSAMDDPDGMFMPPITKETFPHVIMVMKEFDSSYVEQSFAPGFNNRLGTTGLNIV